jgi:hypothetical protein
MVVKSVESYCAKNGIDRVTSEQLDVIRSRMPSAKLFGR